MTLAFIGDRMYLAHSQKPVPPKDRFIRLPEVLHLTGLGKSSIYGLMKQGRFPIRTKFNARAAMWRESEVLTWIQQVAAGGEQ